MNIEKCDSWSKCKKIFLLISVMFYGLEETRYLLHKKWYIKTDQARS